MFTRDPFGIHSQSSTNSASAPQRAHPVFFDDTLDLRRKGKRSFFDRDDESTTSNDSSSVAQRATEPFDPTLLFNFSSRPQTSYYSFTPYPAKPNPTNL